MKRKEDNIRPITHAAASLVISGGVYYFFHSWTAALASFVAGVGIDVDHLLDYYLNYGINLNFKKFYGVCLGVKFKRLFLFLHSFELLAMLWILIYAMNLGIIWIGITIGLTQHVLLDQLVNTRAEIKKQRYFFFYRWKNGFNRKAFVKNGKVVQDISN